MRILLFFVANGIRGCRLNHFFEGVSFLRLKNLLFYFLQKYLGLIEFFPGLGVG